MDEGPRTGHDAPGGQIGADAPGPGPVEIGEIRSGKTVWRFDGDFLLSRWNCIWGRGCLGIEDRPDQESGRGCCSVGAVFADADEARRIAALAATLDPDGFEHHAAASDGGIFSDGERTATRVVDGACVFLNGPGFAGGAGCALHLAAVADGDAPLEWKPSVCAELPLRVDWQDEDDGTEVATLRRWTRGDWGEEGTTMAWCCTEGTLAYTGVEPVVDSLADELRSITGDDVYVELRRRLLGGPTDAAD